MENKSGSGRTLLLLLSASFLVVSIIALLAYFSTKQSNRNGITLPSSSVGRTEEDPAVLTGEGFVSVDPANVSAVVGTLHRPASYHQTLYKQMISDDVTGIFSVHIWASGGVFKMILLEAGQTRHILTDGSRMYLWYEDDPENVVSRQLPDGVSIDDLSGIPTYETILDLEPEDIPEADYRPLSDEDNTPCLFVRSVEDGSASMALWVDLSTGLLCKAECVQDGRLRYSLHQTALVMLDSSDAALNAQLLLPDGTSPFATAS